MIDANLEKKAGRGFFKTILLALTIAIIIIVVLFLILIVYLLIRNPFGIGDALLSHLRTSEVVNEDSVSSSSAASVKVDNPLLSDSEEAILEKIGVDVSSLPSTITPEMETCFVEKLGQARVDEIVAGEAPGIFDALKAEPCLK